MIFQKVNKKINIQKLKLLFKKVNKEKNDYKILKFLKRTKAIQFSVLMQ